MIAKTGKRPTVRLARVILFAPDVALTAAFYSRSFGLPILGDSQDRDFIELDAGGCRLAIHRGTPPAKSGRSPKIVFRVARVAEERARLIKAGTKVSLLKESAEFAFCDAHDPAGNIFQISSRP